VTTVGSPSECTVVAIDIGASSGRVMVARVSDGRLDLQELHRFGNGAVPLWEDGRPALHWDCVRLFEEIVRGLRKVGENLRVGEQVDSIGIDAWAVDYALLDAGGAVLGLPYAYRDDRTDGRVEAVHEQVSRDELYQRNGLQFLAFNTIYQLAAEPPGRLAAARTMLLIPDLFAYWLTGVAAAELTNASTTGLLDVRARTWDSSLVEALGIPAGLLPPIIRPGETVGTLLPYISAATGLPASTPVVAVGSHDTASAVVALPAEDRPFAYISSGTWALVGVELAEPVLTAQAQQANFTNEVGVDGRVRFLRNEMGLWLLSESMRTWALAGSPSDLDELLAAAALLPDGGPRFDPNDPTFLPPGDMPARIIAACRRAGLAPPMDRPSLVRSILDSLAVAYGRAVDDAVRLSGQDIDTVHLIGGGSRNDLLCRLVARATRRRVVAGPVEATATGNALVQARALRVIEGDLGSVRASLRAALVGTRDPKDYLPPTTNTHAETADLPERA
jgi:rhamnulokinase